MQSKFAGTEEELGIIAGRQKAMFDLSEKLEQSQKRKTVSFSNADKKEAGKDKEHV